MRIIIPIASAMAVVLASGTLTACRDKGPVYNTNHPEQGEIVLTTDWSERGEGIDTPGRYVVRVDGDDADLSTFTTDTNVLPELLGPGKHRLSLWNDVPGIVVRGNTATVETTTVSRTGEPPLGRNDFLDGEVGWFFSTAMDVEIEPDMVHNVTAVMHQRVRELTLVLEPTGGSADGIESITAMVSGVAGTIDIETGEYGSPSFVSLPFVRVDSGDDAGKWSASVRMLGVVEQEAPRLTGVISFTGGSPADIPIDSDLSGVLADIDVEDPTTPVVIEGEVVETPSETGFRAVIMDWNRVNRPGVVAER